MTNAGDLISVLVFAVFCTFAAAAMGATCAAGVRAWRSRRTALRHRPVEELIVDAAGDRLARGPRRDELVLVSGRRGAARMVVQTGAGVRCRIYVN